MVVLLTHLWGISQLALIYKDLTVLNFGIVLVCKTIRIIECSRSEAITHGDLNVYRRIIVTGKLLRYCPINRCMILDCISRGLYSIAFWNWLQCHIWHFIIVMPDVKTYSRQQINFVLYVYTLLIIQCNKYIFLQKWPIKHEYLFCSFLYIKLYLTDARSAAFYRQHNSWYL